MGKTVLLSVVGVLVAATGAQAEKIRVPGDFDTIQEAVDAASPGDVIEIRGKHDEQVLVEDGRDLTLVGKGGATIRPGGTSEGIRLVDSVGITIRNLRFEGGDLAIVDYDGTGITVDKCRTKRNNDAGFVFLGTSDVRVIKCRVEDCGGPGVLLGNPEGGAPVAGARVEKCFAKRTRGQGYFVVGTEIELVKCRADDTDDDGMQIGVGGTGTTHDVLVEKCKLRRCGDEGFKVDEDRVTLVKCSADIVDEEGFDVEGDGCSMEGCKASRARRGIEFEGAEGSRAVACKLTNNRENGIAFLSSDGCRAERCVVVGADADGILVDAKSGFNTIVGCKVSKSGDADIRVENGPNTNTYDDNKAKTVTTEPRDT